MRRAQVGPFDFVPAGSDDRDDAALSDAPDVPLNSLRDAEQDVQPLGAGTVSSFAAGVAVSYLTAALFSLMLIRSGLSIADVIALLGLGPRARAPAVDYGASPPPLSDPGSGETSSGEMASGAWSDG